MAGAILYGLMRRVRSSRELEEATRSRLDFLWFLDGRSIDHATFARFRIEHEAELKNLGEQIAREVVVRWGGELLELVLDGTRERANCDRREAHKAEHLEKLVAACSERIGRRLAALKSGDAREEEVAALNRKVEALEEEREKLAKALAVACERDEVQRRKNGKKSKGVRVAPSDPDATFLPNKEGGFAPNYTPTAAVDAATGAILSAGVVAGGEECAAIAPAVADCERTLARAPDRLLADTGFASGADLEKLEAQGVDAYIPTGADLSAHNPAVRPDPTVPVAVQKREDLPLLRGQLAPSAFLYDSEHDQYRCPMGQPLARTSQSPYHRDGVPYHVYACPGKAGCPLAEKCAGAGADHRQVSRDRYQDVRDRTARRMASDAGRAVYRKRAPAIEGVFGTIKQTLGVRQFLLRGLGKVRMEWNWICSAYNLRKYLSLLAARPAGCGI